MAPKYVTLQQGADIYGISVRTLRRRIAEGRLTAYRVGPRDIRIAAADLEQLATPIPAGDWT